MQTNEEHGEGVAMWLIEDLEEIAASDKHQCRRILQHVDERNGRGKPDKATIGEACVLFTPLNKR